MKAYSSTDKTCDVCAVRQVIGKDFACPVCLGNALPCPNCSDTMHGMIDDTGQCTACGFFMGEPEN